MSPRAAALALQPCGHFAASPEACTICAERAAAASARLAAEAVKVSRLDPTQAVAAIAPATAAAAASRTAEKLIGDQPTAGVFTLPDSLYHRDPLRAYGTESLSASSARFMLPPWTPAHYRWNIDHPRTTTAAMIFGGAVHAITLGTAELAVFDGRSWTSEAGRAFLAAHDPDGDEAPILAGDIPAAEAMASALKAHPIAKLGLTGGAPEQAMFAQHPAGAWMRGKVDYLAPGAGGRLIVTDVKTAEHADPESFGRAGGDLGYPTQAAGYEWLAKRLGLGRNVSVIFAVVEKTPPYLVAVHEFHPDDLDAARRAHETAARRFARCTETGHWPGYPTQINRVSLPPWAVRALEESAEADDDESEK